MQMTLWTELKRRNVFRVAAAYAVTAWLLLQAGDILLGNFDAPGWVFKSLVVLLSLGFPIVLVFSWAYEITPDGIKRERDMTPDASITRATGRRLDQITIVMIVLALAVLTVDRLWLARSMPTVATPTAATGAPASTPIADRSIAVLPFVNMSPDADQEYFADGLSEEILNLLAQIRDLKVIGRTSSFAFKGRNVDLREIGETLGVSHLLEGSVRKAGDDLRITAQLVQADDGSHLWSQSYDRRLENVFAIQTEIARSIAAALRVSLVGPDDAAPVVHAAASMPAYERFLQARRLIQGRTRTGLEAARELLGEALALEPDYAPAHAAAAQAVLLLAATLDSYGDIPLEQAAAAARAHLDRALALDPELAEAHAVTGLLHLLRREFERADAALTRALQRNPSLSDALNWHALSLGRTAGRLREQLAAHRRAAELDPLSLINLANLSSALSSSGETDEALAVARRIQQGFPNSTFGFIREAQALRDLGRLAEAHAAAARALAIAPGDSAVRGQTGNVYYRLGDFEAVLDLPESGAYEPALVALGRAGEAIAKTRERASAAPANIVATRRFLFTLSAAGQHAELLDYYRERWGSPAALAEYFAYGPVGTHELAPIAAAQYALGQREALAETLALWGERLVHVREQGNASSNLVAWQARHRALAGEREAALAKLTEAIDLGYRNPSMARDPAFAPIAGDPAFHALVQRNLELINAEREKLGMEPLP